MNVIAIIQARVGSTRLPGKVLLDLMGKSVIERVVERVSMASGIDDIYVATTINKNDIALVKKCAENGVSVFCGSENDVLDRFYQLAKLIRPDHIIRITADCPLIDPEVISIVIRNHLQSKADYTSNTISETFPDGEDVEMLTYSSLEKAWKEAKYQSEREHVTPFIRKNKSLFKINEVKCFTNLSEKRWTLDTAEDFTFIKAIYNGLYEKNNVFGMKEILSYVVSHPWIEKINEGIMRNEGYKISIQNDKLDES